jgi:hypothetical protein
MGLDHPASLNRCKARCLDHVFRERYGIAATREFGGAWNCNGMTAATIGIDVGTSAARVALMGADGALLGIRSLHLAPSDRRNPACWWHKG